MPDFRPNDPPAGSVLAPDVDPTAQAAPPVPGEGEPDITRLGGAIEQRPAIERVAVLLLLTLALFFTLHVARDLFLPIVLAVLLNFLFSPLVRGLQRAHVPDPVGAVLVVLALVGALALGIYQLADPVQGWIDRAPRTLTSAGAKLRKFRKPVEQVTRTAEQVERATAVTPAAARTPEVVVKGPSLGERFLAVARSVVTGFLETMILLYFLLAAGDLFLQKLIKVLPHFPDKRKAVEIARATEISVSTYLFSVALINLSEGVLIALIMWALDMPNPALWGVLTFFLEFVPYLGALVMIVVLALAGLATFDSVGAAMLAPGAYLAINLVQAYVITPTILGKRLTLNPVAILVGLFVWWAVWGVPGAFIAVPLLATFKIVCDHVEMLAPIGEFLGK